MSLSREDLVTWLAREANLDPATLADDTPLFSGGLLDSLLLVDLLSWLEDAGGLKIAWHEVTLENIDTLARILTFCASRRAKPKLEVVG